LCGEVQVGLRELQAGDRLPSLTKEPVSKAQLLKYAGASGDFNLIHTDVETARSVGLPDVIAHGMLSMGFLGQYVATLAVPEAVRRLAVRFNAPVRLGDVLTCQGTVKAITADGDNRLAFVLELWAENGHGDKVTTGEAEVSLVLNEGEHGSI
jgi:acyl dehydratase